MLLGTLLARVAETTFKQDIFSYIPGQYSTYTNHIHIHGTGNIDADIPLAVVTFKECTLCLFTVLQGQRTGGVVLEVVRNQIQANIIIGFKTHTQTSTVTLHRAVGFIFSERQDIALFVFSQTTLINIGNAVGSNVNRVRGIAVSVYIPLKVKGIGSLVVPGVSLIEEEAGTQGNFIIDRLVKPTFDSLLVVLTNLNFDLAFLLVKVRTCTDHVNTTGGRVTAKQSTLGATADLDALYVVHKRHTSLGAWRVKTVKVHGNSGVTDLCKVV